MTLVDDAAFDAWRRLALCPREDDDDGGDGTATSIWPNNKSESTMVCRLLHDIIACPYAAVAADNGEDDDT